MEIQKSRKKQLEGNVISNKMQGTVRVAVDTPVSHPVYKKIINRRKVVFAHTNRKLNIGDKVVLEECRPYSKNIRWIVKENGTERN
jgi:small subunit ribosomal protein S17